MNSTNKNIQDTLIQLLQDGKQVEVPAHGMSMFPLLQPGDILLVNPTKPKLGEIGIFLSQDILIAHRVYKIDNTAYYFKGDGLIYADRPISPSRILGVVVNRKRNSKNRDCNKGWFLLFKKAMPSLTFITGRLFFTIGRIYTKLNKIVASK
jgi:signal peptidase I